MARYKVLKSVAHSLGHSFTSLMNYAYDDYVMGHLLWNARATGQDTLCLDLLAGTGRPAELLSSSIADLPRRYGEWLRALVVNHGSDLRYIREATLTLHFDLADRRPLVDRPEFVASPYVCEVVITDDRGKAYRSRFDGTWYPERSDPDVVQHRIARWWEFWR